MSIKYSKSFTLKDKDAIQKISFKKKLEDLDNKLSKSFDSHFIIPINGFEIKSSEKKEKKEIIHNRHFRWNTQKYDPIQINLLKKLIENEHSTESILEDLKNLQEQCPIINKFSNIKLLHKKDFDLFNNEDSSKFLFLVNASNNINMVNFLWDYFSENVENFVSYLSKLNIYFSYISEENSLDKKINCVLIAMIPSFLYNFISTYADSQFKSKKIKLLAINYNKSKEKSRLDSEYCYESMISLNFLQKSGIEKNEINPTVIYYLKPDISQKLIDLKIIIPPKKYSLYSFSDKNKSKECKGFEKINLSISLKNDVILQQDFNFTIINSTNNSPIGKKIVLNKGYTYIIEIKSNIKDIINNIKMIEKNKKIFIECYNNIVVNKKKLYKIDKYQLLLISDDNIYESSKKLEEKRKEKHIKKNINNFIYSSPQLGISVILNLQKSIRNLTIELEEIKNKINIENNHRKEMKNKEDDNNYNESIYSLKMLIPPDIPTIISNMKNKDLHNISELNSYFVSFNIVSKYLKSFKKDLLLYKVIPFIGKELKSLESKIEWEKIKKLIIKKINDNKVWSNYYQGLIDLLFDSQNPKQKKEYHYNIFYGCDTDFITLIEKLILFIEILEDNSNFINIESIYQGAMLVLGYSYLGCDGLLKLVRSEPSEKLIFRKIISSGKNIKFLPKENA